MTHGVPWCSHESRSSLSVCTTSELVLGANHFLRPLTSVPETSASTIACFVLTGAAVSNMEQQAMAAAGTTKDQLRPQEVSVTGLATWVGVVSVR